MSYTVTSTDRHGKAWASRYDGIAEANRAEALLRDMGHTEIRRDGELSPHNGPVTCLFCGERFRPLPESTGRVECPSCGAYHTLALLSPRLD